MNPVPPSVTRAGLVLGIDVGGSAIKWALLRDNVVTARGEAATPAGGREPVLAALAGICAQVPGPDGVGVAVAGVVDARAGRVLVLPNIPGDWAGFPLAAALGERIGRPVALANDARCFALAELRLGTACGCRDVVFVTLGTGVGGAVAIGGQLHLGSNGQAGELGHQTADPGGLLCGCGNHGCVETLASAPAVVAAAARGLLQGLPTSLRPQCGGDVSSLTTADVAAAAAAGDPLATDVIARAARALGIGLANLCVTLAPERIVVGGGFAHALDVLRGPLERTLSERVRLWPPCPVVSGGVGLHAGAIGAALWSADLSLPSERQPPAEGGGTPEDRLAYEMRGQPTR